jgi:hypothetical protein
MFFMERGGACIYVPTGAIWPAENVRLRFKPIQVGVDDEGKPKFMDVVKWLARNKPVEQMTWAPGKPTLIKGRSIIKAGWINNPGVTAFNEYVGPTIKPGDPAKAAPWVNQVYMTYPKDAKYLIKCFAHLRQHPDVKRNVIIVLGGSPGIGKDSILAPVREAVGPWNCEEISPSDLFEKFNGHRKSLLLRINEAHDLGDVNRYQLYEKTKILGASPPEGLPVNEKYMPPTFVDNVVLVVITTNHKTDGIYLPPDDRRHYVTWSPVTTADFPEGHWAKLWAFYEKEGGYAHVAAYLDSTDLSDFDPKAEPEKTPAFWDVVLSGRTPEDAELADVLDRLGRPRIDEDGEEVIDRPLGVTIQAITREAYAGLEIGDMDKFGDPKKNTFAHWLTQKGAHRLIAHRFEQCSYTAFRNDAAADGLWKVDGKRQVIYVLNTLPRDERLKAAKSVVDNKGIARAGFSARAKARPSATLQADAFRRLRENGAASLTPEDLLLAAGHVGLKVSLDGSGRTLTMSWAEEFDNVEKDVENAILKRVSDVIKYLKMSVEAAE